MYDKEKDLFAAFVAQRMSRRELLDRAPASSAFRRPRRAILLNAGADAGPGRRFRLEEVQGQRSSSCCSTSIPMPTR